MNRVSDFAFAVVFTLLGVLFLRWSKKLFGSFLAPFGLLSGLWFFSLAFLHLYLLDYDVIELRTLATFLLNVGMFSAGCLAAKTFYPRINNGSPARHLPSQVSALRMGAVVAFVLGMIGTLEYYILFDNTLGLDALWLDPTQVRFEESYGALRHNKEGGWAALRTLLIPSIPLIVAYLQVPKARFKAGFVTMLCVGMASLLLNSGRTSAFAAVVLGILSAVYTAQRFGRSVQLSRKLFPAAIVIGAALTAYFVYTSIRLRKDLAGSFYADDWKLPSITVWAIGPYHYMVGPFVAFQELLSNPVAYTDNGNLTFGFLSRILHEINPDRFKYPDYVQPFVEIPIPTNVYTYLDSFYIDYGWAGLACMPFVLGLGSTFVYLSSRRAWTPFKGFLAAITGYCCLSSTGVNRFGTIEVWLWIGSIFLIMRVAGRSAKILDVPVRDRVLPAELPTSSAPAGPGTLSIQPYGTSH